METFKVERDIGLYINYAKYLWPGKPGNGGGWWGGGLERGDLEGETEYVTC